MESRNNKLVKHTIMLTIGTLFSKSMQFLMIPFITAWLSTMDYGTFDVLLTYIVLLIPIITLATGEAVFRFVVDNENEKQVKAYISTSIVFTIVNFGIVMILIVIGIFLLKIDINPWFYLLLFTQMINTYLQADLRALKKLNVYTEANYILSVFQAVGIIIFLKILNMGLSGVIIAYSIGYLFADIYIFFRSHLVMYISKTAISIIRWKEMIRYSAPLIPNDLSWWVISVSDRQIINVYLGKEANGIYALANKIPAVCIAVFGMFSISWQQQIVSKINDMDRGEYITKVYNQMLVVLFTLCSGIMSVNFWLYEYIFEDRYYTGIGQVPILLTAIIFTSIMQFFGGIQIALKRPKENGITTVIGAITNLVIDLLLIQIIGLYAASFSTLASNILITILRRIKLKGISDLKMNIKTYMCVAFYVYFVVCALVFSKNLVVGYCNIVVAIIVFVYMNKILILGILKRKSNI